MKKIRLISYVGVRDKHFLDYHNNGIKFEEAIELSSLSGGVENYEKWVNLMVSSLPTVHHYSWFNIERKIKTYKNYWQKHWESLYDIKQEKKALVDTVEKVLNNYRTLAPCIKAMPKLYDLLPSYARNRHNEIIERAERTKPEDLDIDSSVLDVAMVKDKITKGGNK